MANCHRGEIEAEIGGETRRLRLTLGSLADLEAAFGADDMVDLARRFTGGTLKARDAVKVIAAGLRGGGAAVTDAEVAAMEVDGGAAGYAAIVVRLIAATFGGDASDLHGNTASIGPAPAETAPPPFPGGR
jgi:hypothetical protein